MQYSRPSLSYHLSLRSLFCLFFERQLKTGFTVLSTFIKLPFVLKTFVLSIFEWQLKTGFTVD